MIGDYLTAKIFIKEATESLDSKRLKSMIKTKKESDGFRELKAEAIHIQANRISLEEKDLEGSHLQNKLGLANKDFNEDWQARFLWFDGWYQYLNRNLSQAKDSWETLLDGTESKSEREKLLFWLAKVSKDMKQSGDYEDYLEKLLEEYPIGFYSLFAVDYYGWDHKSWILRNEEVLRNELSAWDVNIRPLKGDKRLNRLRVRAQLSLEIKSKTISPILAKELFRASRKKIKLRHTETHLYISRILYMNSLFPEAMGHTTNIAIAEPDLWKKYPEQILVYYPKPFEVSFSHASRENRLSKELLMAIARQESGFRPKATSWAGAKGLLQLMPKTAEKFSSIQLSENQLIERLEDPKFNLGVASAYLKHLRSYYKSNWPAIAASYNAGEYVVDRWKQQRELGDQMTWIENIPFKETKNYVKKVLRNWKIYDGLYGMSGEEAGAH